MSSPVEPGQTFGGKYRVDRVLGEGGMGIVVAAHHLQLEQRVAIKFLLPEALARPEVVARFAQEARAAAKIQSEHVARVFDVGALDTGAPYMVMEYLEGRDLAEELRQRGQLDIQEAVGFMLQAIEAIAEAHAIGIVHRDLKPANLFLARRPSGVPVVKVLDFGISKTRAKTEEPTPDLTKTATMMGTPYYMSPEQIRSTKDVDARSDVWALGIILYELLTNQLPFDGESGASIIAAVVGDAPKPVGQVREDLPAELSGVIMRCLEKNRDVRFADVGELAAALEPWCPPASMASIAKIASTLATRVRTVRPAAVGAPIVAPRAQTGAPSSDPESNKARTMQAGVARPVPPPANAGAAHATAISGEAVLAPSPSPAKTASAWGASADLPPKSTAKRNAILGIAVVAALAGVGFVALKKGEPPASSQVPIASTTEPASSPVASPAATPPAVDPAPAPTTIAVATVPAASASAAPVVATVATTPRPRPRPTATASVAATAQPAPATSEKKGTLHMGLK